MGLKIEHTSTVFPSLKILDNKNKKIKKFFFLRLIKFKPTKVLVLNFHNNEWIFIAEKH